MDVILVLNAGSSSLKFQIFAMGLTGLERKVRGQIDGIGVHPRFRATDAAGAVLIDERPEVNAIPDLPAATRALKVWLRGLSGYTLRAVGHRVVHGGPDYSAPIRIDEVALERLRAFEALAPLHQPNNLAPIRLVRELAPDLPQVACFDTAFHRNHRRWPIAMQSPEPCMTKACGDMAFMASPTIMFRSAWARWPPRSRKAA